MLIKKIGANLEKKIVLVINIVVMAHIRYAYLIPNDEPKKRYCQPIDVIYRTKKDKKHINPSNVQDFDENHTYEVYWRVCKTNCKVKDECCSFYKCHIISLGG